MMGEQQPDHPTCTLRTSHVKEIVGLLQVIKSTGKQLCSVLITQEGLAIRWEDESKSLQSSVYLKAQLFEEYECPPGRTAFGMASQLLLDTLAVFAASSGASLSLQYPGAQGQLVCELSEESEALRVSTYAALGSLEEPGGGEDGEGGGADLAEAWAEPSSYFLCPGSLVKEAIDDLEWAGGSIRLTLVQDPAALLLAASGQGGLQVELPVGQLPAFHCACSPCASASYKAKHMKAAFSNLPAGREWAGASVSTKVSMDAHGLLKVMHMIGLSAGAAGLPPQASSLMQPSGLALLESQRAAQAVRTAVVQFIIQPLLEPQES